jgi:predicted  nucleic acid-binding Zn-ribbon protein
VVLSDPVEVLDRLQILDLDIEAVRKEGEESRGVAEGAAEELKGMELEIDGLLAELEGLKVERRDVEEKVRLHGEKIESDNEKISEITKDKQLKALNKEISNARKAMRLHEMELASITEKIGSKEEELKSRQGALEVKTADLERINAELEEKTKQWEELIGERKVRREGLAESLSPALLKQYETIKQRRGGLGLVRAKDETCLGCYMHIPPQVYLLLMRNPEEITTCPHCHRILYFDKAGKAKENPSGAAE